VKGEEEEDERTIEIRTIAGGHNLGRKYRIRAETRAEASRWAECLQQSVRKAVKMEQNRVKKNPWQMLTHQCRKIHGKGGNSSFVCGSCNELPF
jgi:hypothetical protein